MKLNTTLLTLLISPLASSNVLVDAVNTINNAPTEVKAVMDSSPKDYQFFSQFNRGSSVSYTGQVFRNILIEDLKTTLSRQLKGSYQGSKEEAISMLNSFYKYDEFTDIFAPGVIDGFSEFSVSVKGANGQKLSVTEGFVYSDIQSPGKNLYDKIAGIDNPLRRGKLFGVQGFASPDSYVTHLFNLYAESITAGKSFTVPNGNLPPQTISKGNVLESGLDLAELTQKFLQGAISYSQAAGDYLSTDLGPGKGLNTDNTQPAKQGASYTTMEHHFDEAFGYFGAARDFLTYSDEQSYQKVSLDSDGNGSISLLTEKNLGLAPYTSRMDLTAVDKDLDLSKQVMEAFLKGRNLITKKPTDYKKYVVANAQVALSAWEKAFAAVTIHYINATLGQYQAYGTESYLFSNFAKFWSEMKGLGMAFQFSPKAIMTDVTFDQIHALFGDLPVLPHASQSEVQKYISDLLMARDLIAKTYGFSQNNTVNW